MTCSDIEDRPRQLVTLQGLENSPKLSQQTLVQMPVGEVWRSGAVVVALWVARLLLLAHGRYRPARSGTGRDETGPRVTRLRCESEARNRVQRDEPEALGDLPLAKASRYVSTRRPRKASSEYSRTARLRAFSAICFLLCSSVLIAS